MEVQKVQEVQGVQIRPIRPIRLIRGKTEEPILWRTALQAPERLWESCDLTTHPHRTDVSHNSAAWRAVRQRIGKVYPCLSPCDGCKDPAG